jgi:RNA-directed DNA polymerase
MTGISGPDTVSPKLQRIAELARQAPTMVLTSLSHHIDVEFLREAHRRTRKDGAIGADLQTASEYAASLDANLVSLLERFKSGHYRAPPVRRVHIPKGNDKTRAIGIPTFEDKILQRAVTMVLEAVYEQDFLDCSYGFRPKRSAHDLLDVLCKELSAMGGGWVLEVDIQSFFDDLDHGHLRSFLDQRVRDGVLRRAIGKWLNAGVLEQGRLHRPDQGTPQGGVISPLLANVYLHEVLDKWFEREAKPRLRGRVRLLRYADDFVITFERLDDAERVLDVLPKRFAKYGLTLHPDKTRLVEFVPPPPSHGGGKSGTFDLLGFTHFWGKNRFGNWTVQQKTARDRLGRGLKRIAQWCREHRHDPIDAQQASLSLKLRGHYGYYGRKGNSRALASFFYWTKRVWKKWLNRRSRSQPMTWERFAHLDERYPLPVPRLPAWAWERAAKL